ncbi:hypothetical protein ABU162_03900 [Paenibacillus thiaminolyticus]|uniref:hypothetical protein n=1 Tax=Paenibacillus thiaminolyticus TaxID=49283 RepID=UPI0035A63F29
MAKFGDRLLQPESGWKRCDDSDPNIINEGDGWERHYAAGGYYNGSRLSCLRTSVKPKIKFNFIGSKLILISSLYPSFSDNIEIKIDGKIYKTTQITSGVDIAVFFVMEGFKFKEHSVEITKINAGNGGTSTDFNLDAIDIDDNGQLKPYNPIVPKCLFQSRSGQYLSFKQQIETTTAIPKMTSNTTPSGRAFARDILSANYDAWYAFNQVDNSEGYASKSGSGGVGFLGYEFEQPILIAKYAVRSMAGSNSLSKMPKDWTFEGSNDGERWHILDTRKNQTWSTINTDKNYYIDNPKLYKMYRLNWTANNGYTHYTDVNQLMMYRLNITSNIPKINEKYFMTYGMDEVTQETLENNYDKIQLVSNKERKIDEGKTFEHEIDLNKYEVNKIILTNIGGKSLIQSKDGSYHSVLDSVGIKYIPNADEQTFINHGMDGLSDIEFETEFTRKSFIKTEPSVLGDGKVFKKKIDTSKIPIKEVSIE